MTNSSITLEGFAYLGLGTVVERTHPEPDVKLSYIGTSNGEAGDKYTGLDRFGRIIDQWWKTSTSRSVDRFKYGYDRNSNRLFRTNEGNTAFGELYHADGASNGYDGLNQLSEFQRGVLSDTNSDSIPDTVATASRYQTWDPDALGNFEGVNTDGTNQSRTHNKQNQSTVVGGNNLTFDDNGNMTTDETGRTITFDAWNKPIKINNTTRYANDALGRRIAEGTTALFYSTNWQVLEEYSSGDPVNRYVWSPVYVDAMVLRDSEYDSRSLEFTERLYVTHDANFNVTSLVSTSGNVVERFVYDPYGRFDFKDASYGVRSSSSYAWVYLHQGGRFDATAALFHFRNRDYSPTLMRWASVDPIGLRAGDVNFYRYEANAPLHHLDPSGLKLLCDGAADAICVAGCKSNGFAHGQCADIVTNTIYWGPIPIGTHVAIGCHCNTTVDGDCSAQEKIALQAQVNSYCKPAPSCNKKQIPAKGQCQQLLDTLARALNCVLVRERLNKKCYRGGDFGHRQAANDAMNAAAECARRYSSECQGNPPGGFRVPNPPPWPPGVKPLTTSGSCSK